MSRLTIDTGTAGNPATGDSLRTAFTKVNTNFEELYAELGADGSLSDLNFTDNIISTDNTNQNIILSPNGTGLIDVDNRRIINVADPTSAQDAATKAYVDAQNVAQAITFVGDDSTGTAVNSGETFKIAGSGSVTTAVSGDTITITGATTNLGDFTFSGNKLSTTSSNADMELDTAGTGNLVLKSGNFLPATDNTQYLGSADKRWHTLYVGPGSINVNGVSITESGGKISLGNSTSISGTLEVNEITSADSSAIQINDGVNISGNVHLQGNTITLGNITESSIDQSLTTIYGAFGLYDHSGNYSMAMSMSVPGYAGGGGQMIFEGNNSSGYALVPSNNNQYTLGRPEVAGPGTGGYWKNLYTYAINFPDETEQTTAARFTVTGDDSTSNPITAGQQLFILGGTNISTAVVGSTVTINGPDLSSYLTAVPKTIDVNEISSSDSSAIQINDAVNISGALTANVINIGNMVIGTVPGDITADADTGINFNVSGPDGGFVVGYLKEVGNNNTSGGELSFSSETGNATYRISLSDDMDDGFATKIWRFDGTGTITFPDSTTQNTAAKITVVGDDSTGVTLNAGETIKIAGTQNITTAVSGDTLTITGPNLSSYLTAVPKTIDVNEISSGDSSAIQINDAVNVSGAGTFHGSVRFNAGYTEKINTLTSSSTITVNCATASIHTVTLAVSTGFVISNLPTGGTVTLIITQGGSGSYTATFGTDGSTTVKFPGGAPTLSTAVGAIDVVTIFNDGTNYLGNIAKAYA